MTVSQRIKKVLQIKNRTAIYIAEKVNVSDGTIRNFKSGKTDPSIKFLEYLISEHPNLNLNWLILGQGEMWLKEEGDSLDESRFDKIEKKNNELQRDFNELKEKFELLKKEYKGQSKDLMKIYKQFQKMDIEGTITQILKERKLK